MRTGKAQSVDQDPTESEDLECTSREQASDAHVVASPSS